MVLNCISCDLSWMVVVAVLVTGVAVVGAAVIVVEVAIWEVLVLGKVAMVVW